MLNTSHLMACTSTCIILVMAIEWQLGYPPLHPLAAQAVAWTSTPWLESGRFDGDFTAGRHPQASMNSIKPPASGLVQHSCHQCQLRGTCISDGVFEWVENKVNKHQNSRDQLFNLWLRSLVEMVPIIPLGSMVPCAKLS